MASNPNISGRVPVSPAHPLAQATRIAKQICLPPHKVFSFLKNGEAHVRARAKTLDGYLKNREERVYDKFFFVSSDQRPPMVSKLHQIWKLSGRNEYVHGQVLEIFTLVKSSEPAVALEILEHFSGGDTVQARAVLNQLQPPRSPHQP